MTDRRGAADQPPRADIASFFDAMSTDRNDIFRRNAILDYEQQVRSRTVLAMLRPAAGERVLDIGCGNARDIIPIVDAGATVVGVDISEGMIDQARRDLDAAGGYRAELEVGDATQLRFADGSFDKVLCSEVIEHIPDAASAVREMWRVLKPGGTLVMSTPNRRSWYGFDRFVISDRLLRKTWNHPFDNWRTLPQLHQLLAAGGFVIDQARTVCYLPGFALTYFLPQALQRAVVRVVAAVEPLAGAALPRNGYLLAVAARKPLR